MTGAPELVLPDAAAELWLRIRKAVKHAVATLGDGTTAYRIGGGTILAARWRHRQSYDVDITVPEGAELWKLQAEAGHGSDFERRMRTNGGEPAYDPGLKMWVVQFDQGEAKLDLWARDPLLGAGEKPWTIAGQEETVLSTAQILRGKLERAELNVARDVVDVIKAAEKEPAALEAAVNAIDAGSAERIAMSWYWHGGAIAEEATTALRGMTEAERIEPGKLGNLAAHAVKNAMYSRCRIQTRDGAIEVETATAARPQRTIRIPAQNAEHEFEALGLNAYLSEKGPGAKAIRKYAEELCARGESLLILEANGEETTRWRTDTAGRNLTPGSSSRPRRGWQP